jgi:hypothetical protein
MFSDWGSQPIQPFEGSRPGEGNYANSKTGFWEMNGPGKHRSSQLAGKRLATVSEQVAHSSDGKAF